VDVVLLDVTSLKADFTYPEHPIKILDQKDHVTSRKTIKFFKIQWSNLFTHQTNKSRKLLLKTG
jgi:hypothetical protein